MDGLAPGDALLLIDVQNDFCPGGALPVEESDRVVPVLNRWLQSARELEQTVRERAAPGANSNREEAGP